MSTLFSGINARIRGTGKAGGPKSPGATTPTTPTTPLTPTALSRTPTPTISAMPAAEKPVPDVPDGIAVPDRPSSSSRAAPLPLWLNPAYAKHIVKGNFMTLSTRPKTVEQGEWLAHHVVEHYRLLWNFVRLVYDKEKDGTSICNLTTCPRMSAGKNHSYTWLNSKYEPVELPAREYMSLMQRWISGKIDNPAIFVTDPASVHFEPNPFLAAEPAPFQLHTDDSWLGQTSGFPREFGNVCRTVFLQMFRVYAHLYWAHFVDFYHLNLEKQLNSCFSHFLLTATALNMLKIEDMEPMQHLVDLWAANGTFPPESKAYSLADLEFGKRLLQQQEQEQQQ